MDAKPWSLILAGGDGTRLRELTTLIAGAPIPKQYCRITGDRSLLEATLDRSALLIPPSRTLAIVNRDHLSLARPQLAMLPTENVLVQPANRETGPGLLLSLLHLVRRAPEAVVAVFPSDHYVGAPAVFARHVRHAIDLVTAAPERLALIGVAPDRAESGYGYVVPGPRLALRGSASYRVRRFAEKPSADDAAALVAAGGLWNSFVMAFRAQRVLDLIAERLPSDYRALAPLDHPTVVARRYASVRPWNFSRDLLTHVTDSLVVVRADRTGWTDWGTPESIERTFAALRRVPPWRRGGLAAHQSSFA